MSATYSPPRTGAPARAGVTAGALAILCALAATHEGEVRHAYVDNLGRGQPLAACYGETSGIIAGKTYTHAECLQMLQASALKHAAEVAKCLPPGLPDSAAAAFYDIGYNMGGPKFCASSMSRKALAGDLSSACNAIGAYVWTNGKDCRIAANRCGGIVRRRNDEIALCRKGLK